MNKLTAEQLSRRIEILRIERDIEREKVTRLINLLVSIHSLMYPPPMKHEDGRMFVFRPKSVDPHEVLQELSDRIRAIEDEIRTIEPNYLTKV